MTMAFAEEVTVFAETNLETRIVMTVAVDITAGDFKRQLEKSHTSCFPKLGEIRVYGLMVKRESRFYHFAESMPLKYIFRDNQKHWFIHAEAKLVDRSQEPSISNSIGKTQTRHCSASDNFSEGVIGFGLIHCENKKIKKSLTKPVPKPDSKNPAPGQVSLDKIEFLGLSTFEPETIRRSSLPIARAADMKNSECFTPKRPEKKPGESVSKSESIGKKLVMAANNIRMQGKTHISPSLSSSIFRSKTRKKRSLDSKTLASLAKFLVFEIPDTED